MSKSKDYRLGCLGNYACHVAGTREEIADAVRAVRRRTRRRVVVDLASGSDPVTAFLEDGVLVVRDAYRSPASFSVTAAQLASGEVPIAALNSSWTVRYALWDDTLRFGCKSVPYADVAAALRELRAHMRAKREALRLAVADRCFGVGLHYEFGVPTLRVSYHTLPLNGTVLEKIDRVVAMAEEVRLTRYTKSGKLRVR